MLGDQAYGDNTQLRTRLHSAGRGYVLSVSSETTVFAPQTTFVVARREGTTGRPPSRLRPDRDPDAIGSLIAGLDASAWQTMTFRDGLDGEPVTSRFAFVRVRAAHRWQKATPSPPREEWLIAEWPQGTEAPTDYSTKGARGWAGSTTPRWSPPPTASSPWSDRTQKPGGRPDTPHLGATKFGVGIAHSTSVGVNAFSIG